MIQVVHRLRTEFARSGGDQLRSLGVTSCLSAEGVTLVATSLAVAAAHELAAPVLLADANCRVPSSVTTSDADRPGGLADVLLDVWRPLEVITPSNVQHLSLMNAGEIPNAHPLLPHDDVVEGAIDVLTDVFEMTIVDLPPVGNSTVGDALAPRLDGMLLVVEESRVDKQLAQAACRHLREINANVLGVVYNKAEYKSWSKSSRALRRRSQSSCVN